MEFVMNIYGLLLMFTFIVTCTTETIRYSPIISAKNGQIRGRMMTSFKGREFYGFLGIPYSKPPLGDLRFKAPQPPDTWNSVRDALEDGDMCIQINPIVGSAVSGSEDCLYLNVFTPKIPVGGASNSSLDVMVFIHGGGFAWGAGTSDLYDPSLLMDKDIVLVVFNYRLGPLGFFSSGDEVSPGNNGLKDQVAVLRWIQDNVRYFGGNPDSVTIFGNSAGGCSVNLHVLSPMSRGLFHKAIAQSGSAFAAWCVGDAVTPSRKLAEHFQCTGTSHEMVSCLRQKNSKDLTAATEIWKEWDIFPIIPIGPNVENKVSDGEENFMPEDPVRMSLEGRSEELVPMMIGIVSEDMFLPRLLEPGKLKELDNKFETYMKPTIFLSRMTNNTEGFSKKLKKFYFNKKSINEDSADDVIELLTDAYFLQGLSSSAKAHTNYAPTYVYMFTFKGSVSYSSVWGGGNKDLGVSHSDELLYLFKHDVIFPHMEWSTRERKVSDILIELWTNFARTGNPTPEISELIPVIWNALKINSDGISYMDISESVKMSRGLYKQRIRFWEEMLFKYNSSKKKNSMSSKTKIDL